MKLLIILFLPLFSICFAGGVDVGNGNGIKSIKVPFYTKSFADEKN